MITIINSSIIIINSAVVIINSTVMMITVVINSSNNDKHWKNGNKWFSYQTNLKTNFVVFQYSFGADPVTSLLDPLEEVLLNTTHTYCGKNHPLFTKKLAHSVSHISWKSSQTGR